jgi:ABC-type transport system involved in multi-copper enzyme maturation permease subunit
MTSTVAQAPATTAPVVPAANLPADLKVTQLRLIRSEWLKFWSLRSSYITLALAFVGMIGFGALFSGVTANRWNQLPLAERAHFEATGVSLRGYFLAQLIVGVLGVLLVTGEYGTGMIRASMAAAPKRLPVIWAKAIVFTVIVFVVSAAASLCAYLLGQQLLASTHIQTTLSDPGVLRTVLGTAIYLTAVGLFGGAIGWIIRSTAGGIATLFGLLLVLPVLGEALPSSWGDHINPYLPSNAGQALATLHQHAPDLGPWTGFGVFAIYIVAAFIAAAVLVKRRDA